MGDVDIQISGDNDWCFVFDYGGWGIYVGDEWTTIWVGWGDEETLWKAGCGHRFLELPIPKGAQIKSAYLKVFCMQSAGSLTSVVSGEKTVNPSAFSTITDYMQRRGLGEYEGNRTNARVDWNTGEPWSEGDWHESVDIKDVIQEIVNLPDWESGKSIVLFWDDHDGVVTEGENFRRVDSYSFIFHTHEHAAILHVEWEEYVPPTPSENPITTIVNALINVLSTIWTVLAENAEIIGQMLCMGFMITPLIHLLKKVHKMIDWVKA